RSIHVQGSRVLVMGLTFKEDCPDIRNTRIVDVVHELQDYGANVDVFDPWVDPQVALHEYGFAPIGQPQQGQYDAIILAVRHQAFVEMGAREIRKLGKQDHVLYDLKYLFPSDESDVRL